MTDESLDTALKHARALAQSVLRSPDEANTVRAQRLAAAELPSLMLFAGILVRRFESQRRDALRRIGEARTLPIKRTTLEKHVKRAQPRAELAFDIVERYVRVDPKITSRARYNVACFFTTLATLSAQDGAQSKDQRDRCWSIALAELDLALGDASLVEWATKDPALRPLEKARPHEWRKIIAGHRLAAVQEPTDADKAAPPEPEPDLEDELRLVRRFVAWLQERETPASIRLNEPAEIEVVTPEATLLVKARPRSHGSITSNSVRSLLIAAEEWRTRRPHGLTGLVLLAPSTATVSDGAIELAERQGVQLLLVGRSGRIEPAGPRGAAAAG